MNLLKLPGIAWRRYWMKRRNEGPFPLGEILQSEIPNVALVDLGAFRKPVQKIPAEIKAIVLMEDRSPKFFLGFDGYEASSLVPLNRHGPIEEEWTQYDLRSLVADLHKQGKKVLIGFWGFWGDGISKPTPWLKKHPELKPRRPGESDIGNPFAQLFPEGITFAEYIANQYQRLHDSFGFDGLFFGDGLCGFRDFWRPNYYQNCGRDVPGWWAWFYEIIAETVHKTGGQLWAYDCMGFGFEEARMHGVDYRLLAERGSLDVLVFQSYLTAWNYLFGVPGKSGMSQDFRNMQEVRGILWGTRTMHFYTLELGDTVEGWHARHETTRWQMKILDPIADGRLLVWANELLAGLPQ